MQGGFEGVSAGVNNFNTTPQVNHTQQVQQIDFPNLPQDLWNEIFGFVTENKQENTVTYTYSTWSRRIPDVKHEFFSDKNIYQAKNAAGVLSLVNKTFKSFVVNSFCNYIIKENKEYLTDVGSFLGTGKHARLGYAQLGRLMDFQPHLETMHDICDRFLINPQNSSISPEKLQVVQELKGHLSGYLEISKASLEAHEENDRVGSGKWISRNWMDETLKNLDKIIELTKFDKRSIK